MKLYKVVALQDFFKLVKDKKMPILITYKLAKLAHRAEEEIAFYNQELNKIVQEYSLKENGQSVLSEDKSSIIIIPGKEEECSQKISDLQNIEVDLSDFSFSIEDFEHLDLTLAQFDLIFPLIKN